jgi:hypothetical protein
MKLKFRLIFLAFVALTAFSAPRQDGVDFSCIKKHKASNTCHFNFIIDGAKYRFVDMGCKWEKKKDEVIKKAKEGSLALAKDWKIDCPAVKEEKEKQAQPGF